MQGAWTSFDINLPSLSRPRSLACRYGTMHGDSVLRKPPAEMGESSSQVIGVSSSVTGAAPCTPLSS